MLSIFTFVRSECYTHKTHTIAWKSRLLILSRGGANTRWWEENCNAEHKIFSSFLNSREKSFTSDMRGKYVFPDACVSVYERGKNYFFLTKMNLLLHNFHERTLAFSWSMETSDDSVDEQFQGYEKVEKGKFVFFLNITPQLASFSSLWRFYVFLPTLSKLLRRILKCKCKKIILLIVKKAILNVMNAIYEG